MFRLKWSVERREIARGRVLASIRDAVVGAQTKIPRTVRTTWGRTAAGLAGESPSVACGEGLVADDARKACIDRSRTHQRFSETSRPGAALRRASRLPRVEHCTDERFFTKSNTFAGLLGWG